MNFLIQIKISVNAILISCLLLELRARLSEDFVEVLITQGTRTTTEFHAAIIRNKTNTFKRHTRNNLNIAMIMFDSQSHSNVQRYLKRTYNWLKNDPNTHIFKGHTIVGDGTTAQLIAMLTNLKERVAPEARRGHKNAEPVDKYPFVFKQLKNEGYVTTYAEDVIGNAAFQYRLLGFRDIPTEKYLRTFWMKAFRPLVKTHLRCVHQFSFAYLKNYFKIFREEKKFIFLNNSPIGHNTLESIALADNDTYDLYQFLQKGGFLENTVIMLFGDHGPRNSAFRSKLTGKLEERLPFLSLTVPSWFRVSNIPYHLYLKENTNVLTSHFDIYATIRHLMNLDTNQTQYNSGKSLLSSIDPIQRTCESAGVESHWCPCLEYTNIDVKSDQVLQIVKRVIEFMNELLCQINETCKKCSTLILNKMIKAGKRSPNEIVQVFSGTKRNSICDSCRVTTNEKRATRSKKTLYEVVFEVSPSGGLFEATVLVSFDDEKHLSDVQVNERSLSRINSYGDQPKCIAGMFPHLRKYCYCK